MALSARRCSKKHPLIPITGPYFACECPSVFMRAGKAYVDPHRKGLLEDVLRLAGGPAGLAQLRMDLDIKRDTARKARAANREAERAHASAARSAALTEREGSARRVRADAEPHAAP